MCLAASRTPVRCCVRAVCHAVQCQRICSSSSGALSQKGHVDVVRMPLWYALSAVHVVAERTPRMMDLWSSVVKLAALCVCVL